MVRSFVIWGALVALAGRAGAGSAVVLPDLQEPTAAAPAEARLTPMEKERKTVNGADLPIYNFKADGLPKDKRYSLVVQWMNGKTSEAGAKGIRIDASGNLLNADGGAIDVMLAPTFPGETFVVSLVSEDGSAKASARITPSPGSSPSSSSPAAARGGSNAAQSAGKIPEHWHFAFDSRAWELGHEGSNPSMQAREYVLAGEKVTNWTELLTSQFARITDATPHQAYEGMIAVTKRDCPSAWSGLIEESPDSVLFEWGVREAVCPKYSIQHEIVRIVRFPPGLLILHYVKKTPRLTTQERDTWVSILREATAGSPEARAYDVRLLGIGLPLTVDTETRSPAGPLVSAVNAIAVDAGIGVRFRWEQSDLGSLVTAINRKEFDLVVIPPPVLQERGGDLIAYSDPITSYSEAVVVKASDTTPYRTFADLDLQGAFGIQGSFAPRAALARFIRETNAHLGTARVYEDPQKMLADLGNGTISVGIGDGPLLKAMVPAIAPGVRVVPSWEPQIIVDVCIGMRKTDSDLLTKINASIARLKADGAIAAIVAKWDKATVPKGAYVAAPPPPPAAANTARSSPVRDAKRAEIARAEKQVRIGTISACKKTPDGVVLTVKSADATYDVVSREMDDPEVSKAVRMPGGSGKGIDPCANDGQKFTVTSYRCELSLPCLAGITEFPLQFK